MNYFISWNSENYIRKGKQVLHNVMEYKLFAHNYGRYEQWARTLSQMMDVNWVSSYFESIHA